MLKLAVPSKGRLQGDTLDWFAKRGLSMRAVRAREYSGVVENIDGVELLFMSANEISYELDAGRIHLGVTGIDLVQENLPFWQTDVAVIEALGVGRADVILAVPSVWIDVSCVEDLDAVAAQFRQDLGFPLRIATKYHNLARGFLRGVGLADYQLVDSIGATEASVKNLKAEAIVDITSTGETLRANHLKPLDDGLILKSEACLYAANKADWSGDADAKLQQVCEMLGVAAPVVGSVVK